MRLSPLKTIALHSIRGGTGKSVLTVNIAYSFAERGDNVLVIDYDLNAPSLYYMMKKPTIKAFLNDYLEGEAKSEEIIRDMKRIMGTKGKFGMIFSNPSIPVVKEVLTKPRRWEMESLKRIIKLLKYLDAQGYDWVIIDAPPGPQYSSINAMVSSDVLVLVTTSDKVEIDYCKTFLKEVYESISAEKYLIVNKVPASSLDEAKEIGKNVAKVLEGVKLLGTVPYYPEVVLYNGEKVMVRDFPHHPFSKVIKQLTEDIISFLQPS